jgi:hypothetical protein
MERNPSADWFVVALGVMLIAASFLAQGMSYGGPGFRKYTTPPPVIARLIAFLLGSVLILAGLGFIA